MNIRSHHYLDCDISFGNFFHVKSDRRNHVLLKLAGCDHIDESSLARILQTDQSQFELFLPEKTANPFQETIDKCEHDVPRWVKLEDEKGENGICYPANTKEQN